MTARSLPILLAAFAPAMVLAAPAPPASPLQIVIDGRNQATASMLTETGMRTLSQSAANVILYGCGALAILFTALALKDLFFAQDNDNYGGPSETNRSGIAKLIIAGLVSIPAVIAAVVPYTLLGP